MVTTSSLRVKLVVAAWVAAPQTPPLAGGGELLEAGGLDQRAAAAEQTNRPHRRAAWIVGVAEVGAAHHVVERPVGAEAGLEAQRGAEQSARPSENGATALASFLIGASSCSWTSATLAPSVDVRTPPLAALSWALEEAAGAGAGLRDLRRDDAGGAADLGPVGDVALVDADDLRRGQLAGALRGTVLETAITRVSRANGKACRPAAVSVAFCAEEERAKSTSVLLPRRRAALAGARAVRPGDLAAGQRDGAAAGRGEACATLTGAWLRGVAARRRAA